MSQLVVVGINYHRSPIAIREKLAIPASCMQHALNALNNCTHIQESVILSTCNRTEVYALVSDLEKGLAQLDSFFQATQQYAEHNVLKPNFKLIGEDVVLHLLRVASGLDSLVLGEGQIKSQVKDAHEMARQNANTSTILNRLFLTALECSKRVRSETTLGRRAVSVSSAALELARKQLGSLHNKKVTILGAGKMAMLCLKHLVADAPVKPVEIINRSLDKAYTMIGTVAQTNARTDTINFSLRHELCANSDLVIVATSASEYLLKKQDFALACQSSNKTPLVIDIAVPRNVDPSIATIPGIRVYTADDLSSIVNTNLKERQALVEDAEKIVFEMLDQFLAWKHSLDTVPTIQELRNTFERIRQNELIKVNGSVFSQEQEEELDRLTKSLINKLLHNPSARLKDKNLVQNCSSSTEMIERIFNLNPLYTNESAVDGNVLDQSTPRQIDIPALPPASSTLPDSNSESSPSESKAPTSACPVTQLVNAITSFKPAAHFVGGSKKS